MVLLIQYPIHYGIQVPLYEYIVIYIVCSLLEHIISPEFLLKLKNGVDTLCYSWFKLIFESFAHCEINLNGSDLDFLLT